MSFEEMDEKELYTVAIEDFALDVKPTDNKTSLLAAFLEDGITWDMYVIQHPELNQVEVEDEPVYTTEAINDRPAALRTQTSPLEQVDTAAVQTMYLVKMDKNVRQNPYFEFGPYRFTDKHPFVPMSADDADRLLRTEQGFAIAQPSEAAEYYDLKK